MTMTMPWKAPDETHANGAASKLDEMRRAFSQEAEHLAQAAAQYRQDAGTHAATIRHDPVGSANSWSRQLVQGLATLGTALALSSRQTAKDLKDSAQSAAKEARSVRLTTESGTTGPNFVPGIALLAGVGAGLALMYFLDPERGRERRQMLGDRLLSWTRRTPGTANEVGEQQMAAEETQAWDTSSELTDSTEQPQPQPPRSTI